MTKITQTENGIAKMNRIVKLIIAIATVMLIVGGVIATTAIKSNKIDENYQRIESLEKFKEEQIAINAELKTLLKTISEDVKDIKRSVKNDKRK
jgi:uncharacterized protein YlxW (UPF0749 family)